MIKVAIPRVELCPMTCARLWFTIHQKQIVHKQNVMLIVVLIFRNRCQHEVVIGMVEIS